MVDFCSKRVLWSIGVTLALIIFVFILEFVFPFLLQTLLVKQELMSAELPRSFSFITKESSITLIVLIIIVSFFKSFVQGVVQFISGSLVHYFRDHQRRKIITWLLKNQKVASARYISIFGEVVNNASASLLALQGTAAQLLLTIAFFASLLVMSKFMTFIALGLMVLTNFPLKEIMKKIGQYGVGINKEWEKINRNLVLILKNMFFIRVSGISSQIRVAAQQGLDGYLNVHIKYHFLNSLGAHLPQFLGVLVILVVSWLGLEHGLIEKAMVVPYLYIFFRFSQTVSALLKSYSNFVFYKGQAKDLLKWGEEMNVTTEVLDVSKSEKNINIESETILGWSLKEIMFGYSGANENVFIDLTLEIPAAKVTVITGRSGRGKSTLLGLLVGEQSPQKGEISFSINSSHGKLNIPVSDAKNQISKYLGYVGPENLFIAGTIRENICFGVSGIQNEKDIIKALEMANCDFILDNMNRLEEKIGDFGEGLSSGQRQRLSLARALLRKPKVLLLDEATSNLDHGSQEIFIDALSQLKGKITVVIITHRPELLKLADNIIDLDPSGLPAQDFSNA